jgi:hypothetical protein
MRAAFHALPSGDVTTVSGWITSFDPRMKTSSLFAASVLFLGLAACSSSTTGSGAGTGTGTAAETRSGGGGGGAGTCDGGCSKYLGCKGIDASNQSACVQSCQDQGYTSDTLAQIEQLDCASVIALIDGTTPAPAPSGGGSAPAKDCYGCQSDGSSCVYVAGAYASACDASCC